MSTLLKTPLSLPIDQIFLCSLFSTPTITYPTQASSKSFSSKCLSYWLLLLLLLLHLLVLVEEMKDGGRKQGAMSPCAACKLLRRRCAQDCVFAPYFPADEPHKFASVHKVFGASNVNKMLQVFNSQPPLHYLLIIIYIFIISLIYIPVKYC